MGRLSPGERKRRDEMFQEGLLWCAKCKQFHPIKDFNRWRSSSRPTNYGYRFYCCRCEAERWALSDQKQRQKVKERNTALKAKFVELAGECCQRCGYRDFYNSLSFHHVYRSEKRHNPQAIINSGNFEKAWTELDKCCLLCMNCHIAYESLSWRAEFIKRDGLGWTVGDELPLDDQRYETEIPPKFKQAPLPLFTYQPKQGRQMKLFEQQAGYYS